MTFLKSVCRYGRVFLRPFISQGPVGVRDGVWTTVSSPSLVLNLFLTAEMVIVSMHVSKYPRLFCLIDPL